MQALVTRSIYHIITHIANGVVAGTSSLTTNVVRRVRYLDKRVIGMLLVRDSEATFTGVEIGANNTFVSSTTNAGVTKVAYRTMD